MSRRYNLKSNLSSYIKDQDLSTDFLRKFFVERSKYIYDEMYGDKTWKVVNKDV